MIDFYLFYRFLRYKIFFYFLNAKFFVSRALLQLNIKLLFFFPERCLEDSKASPIFIFGCGRSGNTLLARLLHETGGVYFPPENFAAVDALRFFLNFKSNDPKILSWGTVEVLESQPDAFRWGANDRKNFQKFDTVVSPPSFGEIIDTWYRSYQPEIFLDSEKWGCKTPNVTPYAEFFLRAFPNSRAIVLVRDPGAVVASYVKAGANVHPFDVGYKAEAQWRIYNLYLKKFLSRSDCKFILFSELIDENFDLKSILEFLKIKDVNSPRVFENPDLSYSHLSNVTGPLLRRHASFEYKPFKENLQLYDEIRQKLENS